jgi:N-acetyl-alpha-D-muramate 1-phosphate uridylyltransferase
MLHALILAAGRGERLRPLTDTKPKPLLAAGGRPLIEWQIERLAAAGFGDIVINHSYLGKLIEVALGDGRRFGVRIRYSPESPALETAGGIAKALPMLGKGAFAVVSGDIYTEYDYARLEAPLASIAAEPRRHCAHFVLVPNPEWHPGGDMGLEAGHVTRTPQLTYGGIAVFHPSLFRDIVPGTWLKLFPWVYRFVDEKRVTGERYDGPWDNVGTADQLAALERRLSQG